MPDQGTWEVWDAIRGCCLFLSMSHLRRSCAVVLAKCSYQAERLFAHLKELAALIQDGDVETHDTGYDADALAKTRAFRDLGTSDRILWVDAQSALQRMELDDRDTVALLRARLDAAAQWERGEFTGWRRFVSQRVLEAHEWGCLGARYDAGRDRLFAMLIPTPTTPVSCECAGERVGARVRLLAYRLTK